MTQEEFDDIVRKFKNNPELEIRAYLPNDTPEGINCKIVNINENVPYGRLYVQFSDGTRTTKNRSRVFLTQAELIGQRPHKLYNLKKLKRRPVRTKKIGKVGRPKTNTHWDFCAIACKNKETKKKMNALCEFEKLTQGDLLDKIIDFYVEKNEITFT